MDYGLKGPFVCLSNHNGQCVSLEKLTVQFYFQQTEASVCPLDKTICPFAPLDKKKDQLISPD